MRRGVALVVVLALALLGGRWVATVYAEWQWYLAHDALPVYRSALRHELAWRAGAGLVAFAFAFANLYAVRRSIISLVLPRRLGNLEIGEAVSARMLLAFVAGTAILLAIALSAPVADWTTLALARIAEPFRERDPFLDRDLAFVVAWLPFETDLHEWASRVMVVVGLVIVALYALTPSLRLRRGGFYVSAWCRRHLTVLAVAGLLLLAWRARLDLLSLTSIGHAAQPYGAYAQRVGSPVLAWTAALTAITAFIVLWGGWRGYGRLAALLGVTAAIAGPVARIATPRLAGGALTSVELREEDRPFVATRRLFTQRAFGVDGVTSPTALRPDPQRAPAPDVLRGIPAWDLVALARSVGAGDPQQVRFAWEVRPAGLVVTAVFPARGGSGAWSALPLEATLADERGRAVPAIPPTGTRSVGDWPAVAVFPGARGAAVVPDTEGRLPAPSFATRLERVAHAWNLRAPRLAAAEVPEPRPRIVFRRDVRDRVSALAPFLTVGPAIVPVLRGDSLYWVAELFTTPRAYPLSERLMFAGTMRPYVHHAASAFVNAATGRVLFVATPEPDAVMRTWMRRFPWLFRNVDDLPSDLVAARPPPVDWGWIRATALARTGVGLRDTGARATLGVDNADADLLAGVPAFFVPPEGDALTWSVPLVDASGRVSGCFLVTGGARGSATWVPIASGARWADILDRLQRAADSAGVGRQRPNARRGRVQSVPLGAGIAHFQSHYEWGADGAPALAGVAAVVGDVARAGATTADAAGVPRPPGVTPGAFRSAVARLYGRMAEAVRRGDWASFGAAFTALGELLRNRTP